MMKLNFDIPKDRKRPNVGRLCLMLGMTALLYLMIVQKFGAATQALLAAAQ
jgi:hypothetical protein